MRRVGLLGGMSWESTVTYYQLINREVRERLGPQHSAELVLWSVDFGPIHQLQHEGKWAEAGEALADVARRLETAGADGLVLCTNTMHKVAPAIQAAVTIPFLHIADATGQAIREAGLEKAALLGTRFTMEQPFYREHLEQQHGLDVHVPNKADRATVHRVIYEELIQGVIRDESRQAFQGIVRRLQAEGAQGVILGCTEIGLLMGEDDVPLPVFDTTALHARYAVDWALAE